MGKMKTKKLKRIGSVGRVNGQEWWFSRSKVNSVLTKEKSERLIANKVLSPKEKYLKRISR